MAIKTTLNATNLASLGADRLAQLLIEISAGDANAKRRLRLELIGHDNPSRLLSEVQKRIAAIAAAETSVGWRTLKGFRGDLASLHELIRRQIEPSAPEDALNLLWMFLGLCNGVIERTNDASGEILTLFKAITADITRLATNLSSEYATLIAPAAQALVSNRYGQSDTLISGLAAQLGETGLKALRGECLVVAKSPEKANFHRPRKVSRWKRRQIQAAQLHRRTRQEVMHMALEAIADAANDIDAFIDLQNDPKQPSTAFRIAKRLHTVGRNVEALRVDDAVADGATVPIRYTSRKTDWQIDPQKLDVLFDQWFAHESDETIAKLKERGVGIADLAKHPKRIDLIAYDIWTHYKAHFQPDGLKAQIVAIDREAVILYKRALDAVIAADLIDQGVDEDEAKTTASAMSACVFSSSQSDGHESEDAYIADIRKDLRAYMLDRDAETTAIKAFSKKGTPLSFLIVCNKLLTGFDAPIEAVMYLDNPLREHTLLQAIARTNRVYDSSKQFGLIVDYIGITKKLDEALETYRSEDVEGALKDIDGLRDDLRAAWAELKSYLKGIKRADGARNTEVKAEFDQLVQTLSTEDVWLTFKRKAKKFTRLYDALSPDPSVLEFTADMKWIAAFLLFATQVFEHRESFELKDYSAKIRAMLHEHLDVVGISTICKIRHITDPDFWADFQPTEKTEEEIKTAAIRKGIELKKVLTEKIDENPTRFGPFSERVIEILKRFQEGQLAAAEALEAYEKVAKDLENEDKAGDASGLDKRAYGLLRLVQEKEPDGEADKIDSFVAKVDGLYRSDDTAPKGWQTRDQLKKELRQSVRGTAHELGLKSFRDLPSLIEDYAVKHYAKFA
ncbi:DUF6880 family protein [Asticcacaulis sp.]|uniref:DUF6880 family protein n=1 Tax=Asticcacaulis sp. TaxID=1872648 RepID=UPI0031E32E29